MGDFISKNKDLTFFCSRPECPFFLSFGGISVENEQAIIIWALLRSLSSCFYDDGV